MRAHYGPTVSVPVGKSDTRLRDITIARTPREITASSPSQNADRTERTSNWDRHVRAQRELEADWGFRSFEEALRSWIATVAIVEVEYVGEWEEYTHELVARDYLEELARRSPAEWASHVETEVAPWDERVRAATVEEESPHTRSRDLRTLRRLRPRHLAGWPAAYLAI